MSSANPSERQAKPLDVTLSVANAVGIALYLLLGSRGWRIPEEHGEVPITSEPFVWVAAVAVFLVFLLADILWGVLLLRGKQSKRWLWWLVTALAWLVAIWVDFAHH